MRTVSRHQLSSGELDLSGRDARTERMDQYHEAHGHPVKRIYVPGCSATRSADSHKTRHVARGVT